MEIEQELATWLGEKFGERVGIAVAALDREYPLWPEEQSRVAGAVARRRIEFSTGRSCARRALEQGPLRAVAGCRDRRHHRAAHGCDRLSEFTRDTCRQDRSGSVQYHGHRAGAALPQVLPARARQGSRLPHLPALRMVEMQLKRTAC